MSKILIIDDDTGILNFFSNLLEKSGYTTSTSPRLLEGIRKCKQEAFDVVLLDLQLPDGNGLKALSLIQNTLGRPEVIIITGEGDPDGAELAVKSGVWDYLQKPLMIDSTLLSIKRALLYHKEKLSSKRLELFNRQAIIGSSSLINESIHKAFSAAKNGLNTLITGETGTGKELFARAIHQNSLRRHEEFVVVDCAALPKNLVESILFGHVKGAFTGAENSQEGLVQAAHHGTLFLDEVGELPLAAQKTFLRVLQEKRFRPVGSKSEVESDFRLISATNRDLDSLVEQGGFRQDLLFRLRTINIELPPLRKRGQDIELIAAHYINTFCEFNNLLPKALSDEILAAMYSYDWPGNVREFICVLENVLAASGTDTVLYPDHLPVAIRAKIIKFSIRPKEEETRGVEAVSDAFGSNPEPFKKYREKIVGEAEKSYLHTLMNKTEWNIKQACTISRLSRPRLYALLKKHKIVRESG